MQAVASLRYGVIFKKAFSQPDVFTAFVRDILGIELIIDHVETEKSFPSAIGNIANHFDLFAEDKVNRIIVDIQHRRYADHYHRFLHYHCVQKVLRTIRRDTLSPEDHARMKDEYSEEELRRTEWEKAEQRGLLKGLERGLEQGKQAERLAVARNLLDVLDDTTIAQKTGLRNAQVAQLRQEHG
ncbi:hypothetical protein [Thiothrix winogradskyi]|uniref:PD-(D/E)XK nuclease family transposase n=1 Tax=Thiothrix winogradskyi TaxID=96472 RepID=A0ABY3SXY0_9GAMM|nr:hypothetical protein [Thiothrix winogradskyi]UJS24313.1 hypothetical protein L2Y54_20645 [Thiothrix winogradskyi]